ncbi:MAG: triose-phosphate isomerase [Formivibrio sp.]|nr:triose-phosphate isomerase [Formivibrio sp.]
MEQATKWVIGNWKMHGTLAANYELIANIRALIPTLDDRVGMAVCPPFPYLVQVAGLLEGSGIALGAQNLSANVRGAYTGDVAGAMLRECSAQLVLIGHSECRAYQHEDDELIARKVRAALDVGLVPVICVGETRAERESQQTQTILARQLDAVFQLLDTAADSCIIAYEPRWAIGTGVSATPETIAEVHGFLRSCLIAKDAKFAASTPILYGGSLAAGNAREIAAIDNVDGGLIGSAALRAEEFATVYRAFLGV